MVTSLCDTIVQRNSVEAWIATYLLSWLILKPHLNKYGENYIYLLEGWALP